jgi:hypothetical protein
MDKMIAYCGLDCAVCPARIALINDDDALRDKTAATWAAMFGFPFTREMINCAGCKEPGAKIGHCAECGIRACGVAKGAADCGACADYRGCAKIEAFIAQAPEARANLERQRA